VFERLREWKQTARRDARVSYLALRDSRTPWHIKALAAVAALYALTPFDVVPDLIPLHGIIDDIIVIPVAVAMLVRLLPMPLRAELEAEAEARMAAKRPHSRLPELIIAVCVLGIAGVVAWLLWFS
jgi:uncharacterized membrane protein YkvA (DUF1232 family)